MSMQTARTAAAAGWLAGCLTAMPASGRTCLRAMRSRRRTMSLHETELETHRADGPPSRSSSWLAGTTDGRTDGRAAIRRRQTRWYYAICRRRRQRPPSGRQRQLAPRRTARRPVPPDCRRNRVAIAVVPTVRRRRLLRDGSISCDRLNLDGRRNKIIDAFARGTANHTHARAPRHTHAHCRQVPPCVWHRYWFCSATLVYVQHSPTITPYSLCAAWRFITVTVADSVYDQTERTQYTDLDLSRSRHGSSAEPWSTEGNNEITEQ